MELMEQIQLLQEEQRQTPIDRRGLVIAFLKHSFYMIGYIPLMYDDMIMQISKEKENGANRANRENRRNRGSTMSRQLQLWAQRMHSLMDGLTNLSYTKCILCFGGNLYTAKGVFLLNIGTANKGKNSISKAMLQSFCREIFQFCALLYSITVPWRLPLQCYIQKEKGEGREGREETEETDRAWEKEWIPKPEIKLALVLEKRKRLHRRTVSVTLGQAEEKAEETAEETPEEHGIWHKYNAKITGISSSSCGIEKKMSIQKSAT